MDGHYMGIVFSELLFWPFCTRAWEYDPGQVQAQDEATWLTIIFLMHEHGGFQGERTDCSLSVNVARESSGNFPIIYAHGVWWRSVYRYGLERRVITDSKKVYFIYIFFDIYIALCVINTREQLIGFVGECDYSGLCQRSRTQCRV